MFSGARSPMYGAMTTMPSLSHLISPTHERRALQVAVAIAGLVPVLGGLLGARFGAAMLGGGGDVGFDSHYRYLSGLLLAIGLAYWSLIPNIIRRTAPFRLLTALVVPGGLARLLGLILHGPPPTPMLLALAMELLVTPLLALWQSRVALAAPAGME